MHIARINKLHPGENPLSSTLLGCAHQSHSASTHEIYLCVYGVVVRHRSLSIQLVVQERALTQGTTDTTELRFALVILSGALVAHEHRIAP